MKGSRVSEKTMAREVNAATVSAVTGVATSSDGGHGLFRLQMGGEDMTLAFPFELLTPLMQSVSAAFADCARIRGGRPNALHVLRADKVDVGTSSDGQRVIFSFHVAGGMPMAFELPRDAALKMLEAVARGKSDSSAPPSGLTKEW
jgi:hypothetical protein